MSQINLFPVQIKELEFIRKWRNEQLEMLRTPYALTKEMQDDFYINKISNRDSNCRMFSAYLLEYELIGMAGLENIQWENRLAEISLLTNIRHIDKIPEIFEKVIEYAFDNLNLNSIFTEVYNCSLYKNIWWEIGGKYDAAESTLPDRKYFNGKYHDSTIYTFLKR